MPLLLNWTDLSNQKNHDFIDRLYAVYGLPVDEDERVSHAVAESLPHLLSQLPPREFIGSQDAKKRAGCTTPWNSSEYTHVVAPFQYMPTDDSPWDRRVKLHFTGVFRRADDRQKDSPLFVEISCFVLVELWPIGLKIEAAFYVSPMIRKHSERAEYLLDSVSYVRAVHGLRLAAAVSGQAVEARKRRVALLIGERVKGREEFCSALGSVPQDALFTFGEGVRLVGEENMRMFTNSQGREGDLVKVTDASLVEAPGIYSIRVYRPTQDGGLRNICTHERGFAIGEPPLDTDEWLVKRYMRTQL